MIGRVFPALVAATLLASPASAQNDCDSRRSSGDLTLISTRDTHRTGGSELPSVAVIVSKPGRCIEARLEGTVGFSDDATMVSALGPGASALFRERLPGVDRVVRFTPSADGVQPAMEVNGRSVPFDDEARAWLARLLPELTRETGFNAAERVARLHAREGTAGALREIATIASNSSKRVHYIALLQLPGVGAGDIAEVVRQASREISSSGDLRELLGAVPVGHRPADEVRRAVMTAIATIRSDGDKREVLQQYAGSGDRETILAVLLATPTVRSDGDKRSILTETAASALEDGEASLRDAWFDAFDAVRSDGDQRSLLFAALPYARGDASLTAAILRGVTGIGSDGDASAVLVAVAQRGLLTTPELRSLYESAARTISSQGDARRVREAASP